MHEHDFLSIIITEVLALFFAPIVILIVFTVAEQSFEPINYRLRYIKTAWDLQIFSVGAQCGLLIDHPFKGGVNALFYGLSFVFVILGSTALLAHIRYRLHRSRIHELRIATDDDVFHALWLGLLSLCVPIEYLIISYL